MPDLPQGSYDYYIGIDPGFKGGIVAMSADGKTLLTHVMPVKQKRSDDRSRTLNIPKAYSVLQELAFLPNPVVGLEWVQTRPDEAPEASKRMGEQLGALEALCHAAGLTQHRIAPNLWKGRLGLPGKDVRDANKIAAQMFDLYYPTYSDRIRGPRGGIIDGVMDAALIAHFLRTRTLDGLRHMVEQYGRDSPQAMAMLFKRKGKGKMRLPS